MSTNVKFSSTHSSPFEIPYVKALIFSLRILGAWPQEIMGEKPLKNFRNSKRIFCAWTCAILLAISYVKKNLDVLSFFELGRTFINIMMGAVSVQRFSMTWTKSYKIMTGDFFRKIHLFHHKNKNKFALKTYMEVEKISTFFTKLLVGEFYIGYLLYNLTAILRSYQQGMFSSEKPANSTFDQAWYYDVPFDYTTKIGGYLVVFVVNCFITYDVGAGFCIFDLYICIMVFHLWGHLKILKHNLLTFPRPLRDDVSIANPSWYSQEESRTVTRLLIESMNHHILIRDFMQTMSDAIGTTICVYFLYHQISECIMLIEMTNLTVEVIGTFGIVTVNAIQQLVQISVVFQLLATQSETIKDAVYEIPWECMDVKNRKIVLIYLCNVQKPMSLKALGILPIGVQTMASILKTTFSYFMLLRTVTSQ